jgi:type VI secretion system secreted protein VgrG
MEVVVSFLDGDPDRPLVVGCVYNAERTVPYGLPGEKTKSTIKSRTTPEGDGKFNEIRLEDKKDAEEIYVHAQKDMKIDVLNDETRTVKHDRKTTIENDDTLTITKNRTYEVKDGNETYKVSTGTRAVTVKGDETHTNNAKFTHTVDGDYALTVKGDMSVSVTGSLTIKAKEITIESSQGTITIKSATAMTLKAGSDLKAEATANLSAKGTAGAKFESPAQVDIKGAMANFKADGMAEVSAGGIMTVKGALVKIN